MVAKGKLIERKYIGSDFQEVCELPNLIGVQLDSYERFLQLDKLKAGAEPDPRYGLESVFRNAFPIVSPNGEMTLNYDGYTLDFDGIKYTEEECKKKGMEIYSDQKLVSDISQIETIWMENGRNWYVEHGIDMEYEEERTQGEQ